MVDADLYLIDHTRSALSKPYGFAIRRVGPSESLDRTIAYVTQPDPAAHRDWVKSIMGAHSYILRQEHPELFAAIKSLPPVLYPSASPEPGRRCSPNESPTARRVRSLHHLKHQRSLPGPLISSDSLSVQFQEGSLLAARERAGCSHRSRLPRAPPL